MSSSMLWIKLSRIRASTGRTKLTLLLNETVDLASYYSSATITTRTYNTTAKLSVARSDSTNKLSVAIVGSGPSGCYTAKYLVSALKRKAKEDKGGVQDNNDSKLIARLKQVDVDVIDRLATPFGLVRSGVAPDHQEVKNVENDFAALFQTSLSSNRDVDDKLQNNQEDELIKTTIEFRGNVTVGKDVSLLELRGLYDIVVLAYGCESDRKLGIDGEDALLGVLSAREFVAWYNGHPDFVHLGKEIEKVLGDKPENVDVLVFGQGNVAVDCARVLAKGVNGLMDTDIASHALPVLKDGVRRTTVIGRRGHLQGAFTIKELRELTKLKEEGHDTSFYVSAEELEEGTTESSKKELESAGSRPKIRIDKLLREAASKYSDSDSKKQVQLRFLLRPLKFLANPSDPTRLGSVLCERTKLQGEPGQQVAVPTGDFHELPAAMALISIGYKGLPLPGMDNSLFNQDKGIVRNDHGKVIGKGVDNGLYVCGWLKRGPSGIIGSNIIDAKDTVSSIIKDLNSKKEASLVDSNDNVVNHMGRQGLDELLAEKGVEAVDWQDYLLIDKNEKKLSRRRTEAQPREKFTSTDEIMELIRLQR